MKLEKGRTYYLITYADHRFTMPGVKPVVYLGKNAFIKCVEEDLGTHQFQDTVSFQRFGYVMDMTPEQKITASVTPVPESDIGIAIVTLSGAISALKESEERAREASYPMLTVSTGKWVTAMKRTWVENSDELKD